MINIEKLKKDENNQFYVDGYRIVYFYDNGNYHVGEFSRSIEDFITKISDTDVDLEDNTLSFISNKDLLERCLKNNNTAIKVAIYKTDGTLIEELDNDNM